jgi:hypothetical protein
MTQTISGAISIFLAGASGVVIMEAVKFTAAAMGNRAHQKVVRYKRGTYWLGLAVLAIIAGIVTWTTFGVGPVTLITAWQVGVNAPALVTAWATASQRDAVVKAKAGSAGFGPNDPLRGNETGKTKLLRELLHTQAW